MSQALDRDKLGSFIVQKYPSVPAVPLSGGYSKLTISDRLSIIDMPQSEM